MNPQITQITQIVVGQSETRMAGPRLRRALSPFSIDRHSRGSGNPVLSDIYSIRMDTRFRGHDTNNQWIVGASIPAGDIAKEMNPQITQIVVWKYEPRPAKLISRRQEAFYYPSSNPCNLRNLRFLLLVFFFPFLLPCSMFPVPFPL